LDQLPIRQRARMSSRVAPLRAKSVSGVLTPAQCEAVKYDALKIGLTKADANRSRKSKVRTSDIARLPRLPEREWLFDLILAKTEQVNFEHWRFALTGIEDIRIIRYKPMQRAKWHCDISAGSGRKLICVVNLSAPETYWRGGLKVQGVHEDRSIAPFQGAGTWFPAYLWHRAKAPWYGERWSLVAALTGPDWV
jgi:hypothetical protein